jgi:hypothetical protein
MQSGTASGDSASMDSETAPTSQGESGERRAVIPTPAADGVKGPTSSPHRWGFWKWAGLGAATGAHALVTLVAAVAVSFVTEGVCREPASSADLSRARISLLVVVLLSVGPWLPATVRAFRQGRHRARFIAASLIVSFTPAVVLVQALLATPSGWTSDWCLF